MTVAQAILDRGYGKTVQVQSIDITENEPIRFAELPIKSASSSAWLDEVGRPTLTGIAGTAYDEQKQHRRNASAMSRS
jgi:hypothetical protein